MISRKKLLLVGLISATLLAIAGCSTGPAKPDKTYAPILSGDWKGDLTIPQDFSSNRGMTDTTCDHTAAGGSNLSLSVHATGNTVNVSGYLQCSLNGKRVYIHELSSTTLELRGEELVLDGKTVGKATPVYFSAELAEGKVTVVKFPTWEKIYFESKPHAAEQINLSGVFADRKTFADDENSSDTPRTPASD